MSGEKVAPLIKRYVIQVNPRRPRLGIDLTFCEKNWEPDARNKRLKLTARIYAFKGGKWVYPGEKRKITFKFKEGDDGKKKVSKEKGICMNFPKKDISNENPDLFFAEDGDNEENFKLEEDDTSGDPCQKNIIDDDDNPEHEHHYLKAATKKAVTEATIEVRCEDYGAFGVLQAIAPDCETIPPREKDADPSEGIGPNDVKIPRDDNDNDIADSAVSWDKVSQDKYRDGSDAPPDEDEDDTPHADDHKGDGLTNYEEYRGFIVGKIRKRHSRTNINKKDVFIYDRDNLGLGYFLRSGLFRHFIPHPDCYNGNSSDFKFEAPDAGTQVINFNRTSHSSQEQHGIRLVNENCNGNYGATWGVVPQNRAHQERTPKDINRVAIDRAACINPSLEPIRRARDRHLKTTIAHELGHSVGLLHHGDIHEHDHTPPGQTIVFKSDGFKGVTGGDVNCVMRYDNWRDYWCHDVATHAVEGICCIHNIPRPHAPGNTFCDSQVGTGFNASGFNVRGDACAITNDAATGRGNCKGRIRVKD